LPTAHKLEQKACSVAVTAAAATTAAAAGGAALAKRLAFASRSRRDLPLRASQIYSRQPGSNAPLRKRQ